MSLSSLLKRTNDALKTNPSFADKRLTTGASNWLWAVFALFTVAFLSWLIWSFVLKAPGHVGTHSRGRKHDGVASNSTAVGTEATTTTSTMTGSGIGGSGVAGPSPERIFHYLWIVAAFAGMVAYFSMASNLGNTPIRQYLRHGSNPLQTRQIFYARYIYWFIAWPMVVTATLLLSGVGWATLIFAVAMQELWVVSWLCGALVRTKYKWGFYVFGIAAYCVLATVLLHWGRRHSTRLGNTVKHYTPLAGALVGIWLLYWIAWGLAEGGNYLSITGEQIFYGILDLITVPLIGFAFLALSRKWDHSALGLHYTQGRHGFGGTGGAYDNLHGGHHGLAEKGALGAGVGAAAVAHDGHHHHDGHHNGATTGTAGLTSGLGHHDGHHNGAAAGTTGLTSGLGHHGAHNSSVPTRTATPGHGLTSTHHDMAGNTTAPTTSTGHHHSSATGGL